MRHNLHNNFDFQEILYRIEKLSSDSQPLWGKMNVEQMVAHLNAFLETALDINNPKRMFIGKVIGTFFKARYVSEKQFSKNSKTHKTYKFSDVRDFQKEKIRSIDLLNQFYKGGISKCTTKPHPFFGHLTAEEWAIVQWKHYDHHLRQFGV